MMMKRTLVLLTLSVLVAGSLAAQGSKTIKAKQISSRTVYEQFLEDGKDDPLVESIERFNEEGELVEVKEMNRKGDVQKWEKYVYNEDGLLVEQQFLDAKGRVTSKEKSIYKDGLRVEKQYFNNRDQMVKIKVYKYEYRE